MELKTKYYEEIFNRFTQQCPAWAREAVEYRPKHTHAIRVTLRNGEQIDYNIQTGSFRFVDRVSVSSPADVTDKDCRRVFAANLAEMMRVRGVGQAILAARTGLSSAMISKYLNEKSTPSITNVKKIARALNCHPDELYD